MKLSSVPVKKGISLFFLKCSVFLSGRRPPDQGRMFEKLHSERVRAT